MLYYITNTNIPTKKAFGYAIAKMCHTFAVDEKVTLVIPRKKSKKEGIHEDLYSYYGLTKNFSCIELPVIDASKISFLGSRLSFLIEKLSFALSTLRLRILNDDICYSRDLLSLFLLRLKTSNLFLEIHYLSKSDSFLISYVTFVKKVVVITSFLRDELISIGFNQDKILVAPDAVDLTLFERIRESKEELRKKLLLSLDKKIILYSGNLFKWKGVYTLVDSIENLSEDIILVILGGSDDTLPAFREYCDKKSYLERIVILGHKKHDEVSYYLKCADVVSIPNSAEEHISKYNTSPLKLFEYMATGNPIVASNLPSLREVLSENNSFFALPDDAESLSISIKYILDNNEESIKRSKQALLDVQKYTWDARAKNILDFIKR